MLYKQEKFQAGFIPRERDPNLIKIEKNAFNKMQSVIEPIEDKNPQLKKAKSNVAFVSVEQALKELISLNKS